MKSSVLIRVGLVVGLVAVIDAQSRRTARTVGDWIEAVERHSPGTDDAWVAQVAAWTLRDLHFALNDFRRVGRADANTVLKRAAIFHVDIAIMRRIPGGYDLPGNGHLSLFIRDGEVLGKREGTYHWAFARSCLDALMDGLRPSVRTDQDVRRWYHAVAATLHQTRDYPELRVHLEKAFGIYRDDATLEMYSGTMHEAWSGRHVKPSTGQSNQLFSTSRERELAEESFRRALKIDASLNEARIRLGQVLDARGQHDAAVAELERALKTPLAARLEYWGRLLLGRAEHARDRLDAAAKAFTRAHALFPDAPSPILALSQVARDRGDRAAALQWLGELPDVRWLDADSDPWWSYPSVHEPDATTQVVDVRKAMAR
jgi:tetratricopeptide (TPR) repeat protein